MAQFLRPDGNVTQTSFTGGFAEIDESSASDADFAYGENNVAAVLEVSLSNPSATPGAGTITVRYRIAKTNAGTVDGGGNAVTVTCAVVEGTTVRATDTARTATGTWTTYSFTPDLSAVTNWNDVRLRFTTSSSGGNPSSRRGAAVSWAEIETPDGVSNPALSTFTEDYSSALDSGKWDISNAAATGGVLELSAPNTAATETYAWTDGLDPHTLDEVYFQIVRPQLSTGGAVYLYLRVRHLSDNGEYLDWLLDSSNGHLIARYQTAFTPDGADVDLGVWSDTNHKWVKISFSGGTATWWTAPDSGSGTPGTWTSRRTKSSLTGFTAVVPAVFEIKTASATVTQTPYIDGLNTTGTSSGGANTDSDAQPATYATTPVAATSLAGRASNAQPAAYTVTAQSASSGRGLFSDAQPATYTYTPAAATSLFARLSNAQPATYTFAPAAASALWTRLSSADPATFTFTPVDASGTAGRMSSADPATYTLTGADAASSVGELPEESAADPATFAMTGAPATSTRQLVSVADSASYAWTAQTVTDVYGRWSLASPATYTFTGFAGKDHFESPAAPATFTVTGAAAASVTSGGSQANPASYTFTPTAATGLRALVSVALPAGYTLSPAAATSIRSAETSVALPAAYALSPAPATDVRKHISVALPANFLLVPFVTADVTTGEEQGGVAPETPALPPDNITDEQFLDWLTSPSAMPVVLMECQCLDEFGNAHLLFFGNRSYTSGPFDNVANQAYDPFVKGGLDFASRIALDADGEQSYGDIELDNTTGELDWVFPMSWQYQPVRAYLGDLRWSRNNFRMIFDGTCEDIDSSMRDTVNVRLRDKLWRLDMPLHDQKIGGTSAEADRLLPVCFGECHNVTPVLMDANALTYCFHARRAEEPFEVRDNGIPVPRVWNATSNPATFALTRAPAGRITASVQGDWSDFNPVTIGYQYSLVGIVYRLVTEWGTEPGKRLVDTDIDLDNFFQFSSNHPQACGLYVTEHMTVLEAAQQVAGSIGARLVMTALGKLQLIQLSIPPFGAPIDVGPSDMVAGSLHIASRPTLRAGAKVGYNRNWTVQPDTASGLPEEHKKLFAQQWLTATTVNEAARELYGLWSEPPQEDTLLIVKDEAEDEAMRRASLRSTQRHVYGFTGFANLIFTPLGSPMRLTHHRFGLDAGKIGQVVGVAVDWSRARVNIEVLA